MKFKKTSSNLYILLLITIGIFSSVRAMQSSKQEMETIVAKSSAVDYDSSANDRQGALIDFSYRLPVTHFEPLLLFVFGAVLLSIVTGVNIFRSRKIGFHLNSASQASLESHQKFRARGSKDYE
jgi:hypothetical protein